MNIAYSFCFRSYLQTSLVPICPKKLDDRPFSHVIFCRILQKPGPRVSMEVIVSSSS